MRIATAESGEEHSDTAFMVQALALALRDAGNADFAEAHLRRVVRVFEREPQRDAVRLAAAKSDLALLLKRQRKNLDEAADLYREAVLVATNALGPAARDTLVYKHNLAELLDVQGRADEAGLVRADLLRGGRAAAPHAAAPERGERGAGKSG